MATTTDDTEFDVPELGVVVCPECSQPFESSGISIHWTANPSHRPPLDTSQRRIVDVVLALDGGKLVHTSKHPCLEVITEDKRDLLALDDAFGLLSTGINDVPASIAREIDHANVEEGESAYVWRCRCHPDLLEWVDEGVVSGSSLSDEDEESDPKGGGGVDEGEESETKGEQPEHDQQSQIGEWYSDEPTFAIPDPQSPLISIRERLRGWVEERGEFRGAFVTVTVASSESDARDLFENAPIEPMDFLEHGEGVDVAIAEDEVNRWI